MWTRFKRWALLPQPHRIGGSWKHVLRFVIILICLLFASVYLSQFWVFEYAGLVTSDAILKLRKPEPASRTAVVSITNEERKELLGDKLAGEPERFVLSPIPSDLLLGSICSILRQRPKVLGIDLNTSEVHLKKLPRTKTRIVWSQSVRFAREWDSHGNGLEVQVQPEVVLAGDQPNAPMGLAVAPVSRDWSVREIYRCYAFNQLQALPTFVAAIQAADEGKSPADCKQTEEEQIGSARIDYHFDRFTLHDLEPEPLPEADLQACLAGVGEFSDTASKPYPLAGKIVLLGGEYDTQDWHPTPFGMKPGVEIVAGMVEHIVGNKQGKDLDIVSEIGIKVALALLIAFIHSRLKPLAALLCSTVVLAILVFAGGAIAALLTAYRATTVPFLLGIVIEQLVTSAEHAQEGASASHASSLAGPADKHRRA